MSSQAILTPLSPAPTATIQCLLLFIYFYFFPPVSAFRSGAMIGCLLDRKETSDCISQELLIKIVGQDRLAVIYKSYECDMLLC